MSPPKNGQLTPNFHLSEFIRPGDPMPGEEVLKNINNLAQRLQVLRDLAGHSLTINSGYRNPDHNAAVGGKSASTHLTGQGVDIPRSQFPTWMITLLRENWSGGMGLYPTHIHLDTGPKRRW